MTSYDERRPIVMTSNDERRPILGWPSPTDASEGNLFRETHWSRPKAVLFGVACLCSLFLYARNVSRISAHQTRLGQMRFQYPSVSLRVTDDVTAGYTKIGHHPYIGNIEQASIKMELFCDLQCPYCRLMYAYALGPLLNTTTVKELQTDVSLTFHDFPLSFHKAALPAAIAARCAGMVTKSAKMYWNMQLMIYSRKDLYAVAEKDYSKTFVDYAQDLFGDNERTSVLNNFVQCYRNQTPAADIQQDLYIGELRGVRGTPTLFINGKLSTARSFNELERDMDVARKMLTTDSKTR